jgi:hypothetical protein
MHKIPLRLRAPKPNIEPRRFVYQPTKLTRKNGPDVSLNRIKIHLPFRSC